MKCPNCGKQMDPGYIQGGKRIYFNKEPTRHPDGKSRDSIPVESMRRFWAPATCPAWHCPYCEIISIDLTDPRYLEK